MLRWITIVMLFFLLTGCAMAGSPAVTRAPSAVGPTEMIITLTMQPPPTYTPAEPTLEPCAYMWATKDLPEVSGLLAQAVVNAGLSGVQEARASAYGENCVTPGGKVQAFHAMQTDFYFTIAAENLEDTAVMGEWVEKLFPVLDRFPPGQVPGPNLGYVGIRFTGGEGVKNLWFRQQAARDLLQQGLRQGELYEALNSP